MKNPNDLPDLPPLDLPPLDLPPLDLGDLPDLPPLDLGDVAEIRYAPTEVADELEHARTELECLRYEETVRIGTEQRLRAELRAERDAGLRARRALGRLAGRYDDVMRAVGVAARRLAEGQHEIATDVLAELVAGEDSRESVAALRPAGPLLAVTVARGISSPVATVQPMPGVLAVRVSDGGPYPIHTEVAIHEPQLLALYLRVAGLDVVDAPGGSADPR